MAEWAQLGIPELLLHSCGLPSFGIWLLEGMVKRHSLFLLPMVVSGHRLPLLLGRVL